MEERGNDALLDFPQPKTHRIALDIARAPQLAFDDPRPCLLFAFVLLGVGHGDELAQGLGQTVPPGCVQEDAWPYQR